MARELDELLDEVIRVAGEAGEPILLMKRGFFWTRTHCSDWDQKFHGLTWGQVKELAHYKSRDALPISRKSKHGMRLRLGHLRQKEREVGRMEYLSERLEGFVARALERTPVVVPKRYPRIVKERPTKRILNPLWSDLHFGIDIKSEEVLGSEFNWTVASRYMGRLCEYVASYKTAHRDETELNIILNGDLIEGIIHLEEANLALVGEQVLGATQILINCIDFLSAHFKGITVHCVPGNHGRRVTHGKGRRISQRWDSHEHDIYLALACAFRKVDHVKFNIPRSGFATWLSPGGELGMATHGDLQPTVGNVGKSLNTGDIAKKVMEINEAKIFDQPLSLVAYGHWHTCMAMMLSNGCHVVVNGGLKGGDSYVQNALNIWNPEPAQVLFESTDRYILGDITFVKVRHAAKEERFNDIVRVPSFDFTDI